MSGWWPTTSRTTTLDHSSSITIVITSIPHSDSSAETPFPCTVEPSSSATDYHHGEISIIYIRIQLTRTQTTNNNNY